MGNPLPRIEKQMATRADQLDRTVHAAIEHDSLITEVVRYERAGKWYLEVSPTGTVEGSKYLRAHEEPFPHLTREHVDDCAALIAADGKCVCGLAEVLAAEDHAEKSQGRKSRTAVTLPGAVAFVAAEVAHDQHHVTWRHDQSGGARFDAEVRSFWPNPT
ncbi:hypothetical protein [Tessaracoccus sp.]